MKKNAQRPRRLRQNPALRKLVSETRIAPAQLVQPLFVVPGTGVQQSIDTLPGVQQYSVDRIVDAAKKVHDSGVGSVLLFGTPESKDAQGSEAWASDGTTQRACLAIRECVPDLTVMTDVCLCAYTTSGHCGVSSETALVANDASLPLLSKIAVSHAQAGAHVVAPSDMMDGRVGAIRSALDDAQLSDTVLMSYAVKYASAFYGPFRGAQDSTPEAGSDRRGYQMDPANLREAYRELALDEAEGADILMVKPAIPCLDIIRIARDSSTLPLAAYHVSGEYAMIKAAAAQGLLDEQAAMDEALLAIKRAGADIIITYAATDFAQRQS